MANALKIAPPPPRLSPIEDKPPIVAASARAASPPKFNQAKADGRVQFNKRVTDGFDMLAIRTRCKVPALLAEPLELLEERYGKI